MTYRCLLMPTGIILSNGHTWKQQRHIGITSLQKLGMGKKSIEHRIEEVAQTLVEAFRQTKGPHKKALASVDWIISFAKQEIQKHKESSSLHEPQDFIDYYLLQMEKDRNKLPYTNAVIHEMQRVKYALLFGVPRQAKKDVKMRGYHIPKGTFIAPDLRSVLLDSEQWEKPEEFNPNHFLDKDGKFIEREEFLAFGTGLRVCMGQQLARIEIFILLTSLLRSFNFKLPEGVKEFNQTPVVKVTMPPQPYKLCAIPHKS
ncbi:cytochrome P450 2J2-like [Crotalus adamanteus]|uniref:Cytochrome P450 2J2-like n=1 Tax=Crotalus adamanteus TaxID=8729 RepID=A0AAW1BH34_CROAD